MKNAIGLLAYDREQVFAFGLMHLRGCGPLTLESISLWLCEQCPGIHDGNRATASREFIRDALRRRIVCRYDSDEPAAYDISDSRKAANVIEEYRAGSREAAGRDKK